MSQRTARISFIKNGSILTLVSLASRLIGVGFNSVVAARLGADGLGLQSLISSVTGLALTLAVSGVQLASNRLCAEALEDEERRRALGRCAVYASVCGMLSGFMLFVLADAAAVAIGDRRAALPLRILSAGLLPSALSAALMGYFSAVRRVSRTAAASMLEQLTRLGLTMLFFRVLPTELETSCAALALGATLSGLLSFLLLCGLYRRERVSGERSRGGKSFAPSRVFGSCSEKINSESRTEDETEENNTSRHSERSVGCSAISSRANLSSLDGKIDVTNAARYSERSVEHSAVKSRADLLSGDNEIAETNASRHSVGSSGYPKADRSSRFEYITRASLRWRLCKPRCGAVATDCVSSHIIDGGTALGVGAALKPRAQTQSAKSQCQNARERSTLGRAERQSAKGQNTQAQKPRERNAHIQNAKSHGLRGERHLGRGTKPRVRLEPLTAKLLSITLPTAAAAYLRSGLTTLEHILIPRGLRKNPVSSGAALASYGSLSGMAIPIVMLPTALLYSFTSLLVTELAEARARGEGERIKSICRGAICLTVGFSLICAVLLYAFADRLGMLIYKSEDCGRLVRLMAPLVPVMYLDHAIDSILKGLGKQLYCMKVNLIDSALSVVLVLILCERLGIYGYVLTIYICEGVNALMSCAALPYTAKPLSEG